MLGLILRSIEFVMVNFVGFCLILGFNLSDCSNILGLILVNLIYGSTFIVRF